MHGALAGMSGAASSQVTMNTSIIKQSLLILVLINGQRKANSWYTLITLRRW